MFDIKFTSLEEAKKCYGEENLIPITKIKQLLFYAKCGCQPKFIWESEKENEKIVGWFLRSETAYVYKKWQEARPNRNDLGSDIAGDKNSKNQTGD